MLVHFQWYDRENKQPVIYYTDYREPQVTYTDYREPQVTYNLRPNNMAGIISKITARPA